MITPLKISFPKSAYFRLMEHQSKLTPRAYHADAPLVLFITFSRIAAGLSLVSVFFPPSITRTGVALIFMVLATAASIAHLKVPLRFLTMIRNSKSFLVWEVRLAGALTTFQALYFFSFLGYLKSFQPFLPWINFLVSILFLISTGWAYRFETHPAWKTSILPGYYLASACLIGLVFRAMYHPFLGLPLIYGILIVAEAVLLLLYKGHLQRTSSTAFESLTTGSQKRIFLAFLWSSLLVPALVTLVLLFTGYRESLNIFLALSCSVGILIERILFFKVERPVFFLSFVENRKGEDRYWIRG